MNNTLKIIINKTIDREFKIMIENYKSHLNKDPYLSEEELKSSNKLLGIIDNLYKILPEESHHLIAELEETTNSITGIESRVAFKEGVILGLTELRHLNEVGEEIAYI